MLGWPVDCVLWGAYRTFRMWGLVVHYNCVLEGDIVISALSVFSFVFLFACFMSVRFYVGTDQRQRIQVPSWSQSSKPGSQNTLFLFLS